MFCEFEIAVYLSLRERICSPKEFAPLIFFSLLLKEFACLRFFVSLCLYKQVVYSIKILKKEKNVHELSCNY